MPSPLGRVAPKEPGEVRYRTAFSSAFRRIHTAYQPHPPLPHNVRRGTFPKGEGYWDRILDSRDVLDRAWHSAMAMASAASSGLGIFSSRRMRRVISWTWCLVAPP